MEPGSPGGGPGGGGGGVHLHRLNSHMRQPKEHRGLRDIIYISFFFSHVDDDISYLCKSFVLEIIKFAVRNYIYLCI